ncbi:MAG: hypothetical protein RIC35_17415 [Marinoscillum sp.]
MKQTDIKSFSLIVSESYMEDGVFLSYLWDDIYHSNPAFKFSQTLEALIFTLRFMIDKEIAVLIGYDQNRNEQIFWDGEGEDELKNLANYVNRLGDKVKKTPVLLDGFKYPSFKWKIPYPMDPKKYGL